MLRFWLLIAVVCSLSWGVEIKILRDSDIQKVTQADEQMAISDAARYSMRLEPKAAREAIIKNRVLADVFLKEHKVPTQMLNALRFNVEKGLAREMVMKAQEKLDLSDKVLRSYYLDHIDAFKTEKTIAFKLIMFADYMKAAAFYDHYKDVRFTETTRKKLLDENATVVDNKMPLGKMHPALKILVPDTDKINFLTPPQYFKKKYVLLYVESYFPEGHTAYEKVKGEIRQILLKKEYLRTKERLYEIYSKKDADE